MATKEEVEKSFREGQRRVEQIKEPLLNVQRMHPCYIEQPKKPPEITPTGHLAIFDLLPNDPSLPRFSARLEEKKRSKKATIDIDIYNAPEQVKKKFVEGRKGYEGHHTEDKNWHDPLRFKIRIKLPDAEIPGLADGFILEGSLELNKLWLRACAETSIKATGVAAGATVTATGMGKHDNEPQ